MAKIGISKQISASWIAAARLSGVYPSTSSGSAPSQTRIDRKKPCQYEAKIISLMQRNLGTGRNGERSFDMHTQNMPSEYRLRVTLMLYTIPVQRYPER